MLRQLGLLTVLLGVSGCNLVFGPGNSDPDIETGPPELKRFASESEFVEYFSDQLMARNADVEAPVVQEALDGDASGAPPQPGEGAAVDDSGGGRDYSETTTQEVGVDEADVVKTDGEYFYLASSSYFDGSSELQIVKAAPAAELALVSEFPLEGYARELYLHDNKVVAITETYGNIFYLYDYDVSGAEPVLTDGTDREESGDATIVAPGDDFAPDSYEYERPRTFITVIDVSDRANPALITQTAFDGTGASSRMIDGVLHLVLANYQNYYYDVLPLLGRPDMVTTGGEVDASDVLPHFTRVDAGGAETSGMVLTWEDVYRPGVPDGFGVVAVIRLDANNSAVFDAVGVVAEPGLIYSSREALYLTNTNYDFFGNARVDTDVYKFQYTAGAASLTSVGRIPGRVLNQYSMGEHNGYLRVATTVDPTFDQNGVVTQAHNNVYVLGEADGALNIVGSIEDLAERETIQSARFAGDRGYLVTFEQIDPLFTLDLSDPANPRVVGELKVPGFSTFIVPMDDNHVLTVGQYIPEPNDPNFFRPWGVQLSIFDVTDFANPVLKHNSVIGADTGAYSEALYNPKAFTYFAEGGFVALPISIYDYGFGGGVIVDEEGEAGGGADGTSDGSTVAGTSSDGGVAMDDAPPSDASDADVYVPGGFDGLMIYRVSTDSGFSEMGSLSARFESAGYYYSSFTRGVFIGDEVYAVTDNGVRAASLTSMEPTAELLLRDPVEYEPVPSPEPVEGGDTGRPVDDTVIDPAPPVDGIVPGDDKPAASG